MESEKRSLRKHILSMSEIVFITLMAVLNVGFDLFLSPLFILLLGHVVAGILIMVPINFIFISLTKHLVDKFGTLVLYMIVFSALAIPTTFFGAFPGIYKLLVGVAIGILLDLVFFIKTPVLFKIFMGGLLGAIGWWLGTFLIWTLLGFPYVTGMSNFLNEFIPISRFISLPITKINSDFFLFVLICGLLSAIPCVLMCTITYPIAKTIKSTSIYEKFNQMQ
ncbi:MAG: hypothetical protein JW776_12210 [Candidatus Lokiarchaeota archaeon]|nr:hypothetical protein [Candidatus Lokiarchaeota archaeon]